MDLIAMEWEGVDWVNLAYRELWEAVINPVMKIFVP
jgi:hypothetical protein